MRPQAAETGVGWNEIDSIINILELPGRGLSARGKSGLDFACIALDFEGRLRARSRAEPKLWAVWRDRGMALATKSGIWA
jgi:hypothetical protein